MWLMLGIVIFQGGLVRRTEAQALQSMVIVTGDHGRGSAFVVSMEGKTYLVTNSHVVQGNTHVKFKTLDNQELLAGPLQIADKADLVRAEVASTTPALKVATQLEQKLKIGDAIVVSGNSEGEGVVREIPGKLVGIGPDRIEVDAKFVPGNSGSPILTKTAGSVIGVATYMTMPPALKKGEKSPTSLNEVRRFGYRLDTVGTWVSPDNPDRLEQEGLKLERMDETMHVVISILDSKISDLARGSSAYVNKEQAASNPSLAALAVAIDDFAGRIRTSKQSTKARLADSGTQYLTKFIEALRAATVNDVRGFKEENFSGFFAMKFNEHLDRRKELYAFLDDLLSDGPKSGTSKASQTADATRPTVDYSKLSFQLTQDGSSGASTEKRLRASYPANAKPAGFTSLYWALQKPDRTTVVYQMRGNSFDLPAASDGLYKLSVEYRPGSLPRTISNVLEFAIGNVGTPAKSVATGVTTTSGSVFTNTLGMKFVPVAGTRIWMCIHETRKGDYAEYAKANPKVDQAWKNPMVEGIPASTDDSHPVVSVSWGEAVAFCEWLSEKEGRKYRLPTDREWSFAVGLTGEATDGTPESLNGKVGDEYPWGKTWPPPKGAGNYADESMKERFPKFAAIQDYSDGFATTAPVMSFEPNKLGIYDLGGNVVEYCQEHFGSEKYHVVRGASWYQESAASEACLSSTRGRASTRNTFRGFRCVMEGKP